MSPRRIAFQGELGANSHEVCLAAYPDHQPTPYPSFEDAFEAVRAGDCELGMIPVENSIAGRVADVHHLLPSSGLKIIGDLAKSLGGEVGHSFGVNGASFTLVVPFVGREQPANRRRRVARSIGTGRTEGLHHAQQ